MNHRDLWGKAAPANCAATPCWHPLVAHMLDVAACANVLLVSARSSRLNDMAACLGLAPAKALPWLLLFVALHDLGKATPAFQMKVTDAKVRLSELGYDFPDTEEPHGAMSTLLVPDALLGIGVPGAIAAMVGRSIGAHHGAFVENEHLNSLDGVPRHTGKRPPWALARKTLVDDLVTLFGPLSVLDPAESGRDLHSFCVDLAGLTTAADWLGSNADMFGYVDADIDLADYFETAKEKAKASLLASGFREPPRPPKRSFRDLFGKEPWPLHRAMESLLETLPSGTLVIVEASMGEGKTEAALLAYDALAGRGSEGLFFALPTQATANQMLGRVERYMRSSFDGRQGLHLVHGGAGLSDKYDELRERAIRAKSIDGVSGDDEAPVADAWFCRSKRALLAPFGVGTVDQALLGVLRTKHHFLRLHGLAGKVFVVDEVHAYDTFTSSILARLCEWLQSLGTTVVLLSATLSSPQRATLLAAYGVTEPGDVAAYPRLTVARRGEPPRSISFPSRRAPVAVRLEWKSADALPSLVAERLRTGGCIAWIVNTVARAQELYLTMESLLREGSQSTDLQLLHARFPMADRLAREARAEAAFGPPGTNVRRPHAALLIGTQVLEQSLDFDFDLMVTEVAPVDLVLQRAGRLHRHQRESRPAGLDSRTLWLQEPAEGPRFGATARVYDEAILIASYLVLKNRGSVYVPTDIEPFVEAVYVEHPDRVGDLVVEGALADRLREARRARQSEAAGQCYLAELKLLPPPDHDSPFGAFTCRFDEEDPAVHEALKAVTRLGDPSVTVVPVRREGTRYALFGHDVSFDPDEEAVPFKVARELARGSISVSRPGLVHALVDDPNTFPRAFRRTGLLGHHRVLVLDERGCASIGNTDVALDPELGLLVGAMASERLETSGAQEKA